MFPYLGLLFEKPGLGAGTSSIHTSLREKRMAEQEGHFAAGPTHPCPNLFLLSSQDWRSPRRCPCHLHCDQRQQAAQRLSSHRVARHRGQRCLKVVFVPCCFFPSLHGAEIQCQAQRGTSGMNKSVNCIPSRGNLSALLENRKAEVTVLADCNSNKMPLGSTRQKQHWVSRWTCKSFVHAYRESNILVLFLIFKNSSRLTRPGHLTSVIRATRSPRQLL